MTAHIDITAYSTNLSLLAGEEQLICRTPPLAASVKTKPVSSAL